MTEIHEIQGYHVHVYFDPATRPQALALREAIESRFVMRMGRVHDKPVGPHPEAMYQVAFEPGQFAEFVPWLALNRNGLTILVHPETDDAVADHTSHALWMGRVLPLNIAVLSRA